MNWAEKYPTFTYGPQTMRTMVAIVLGGPQSRASPRTDLSFTQADPAPTNLDKLKCMGPSLYEFGDDGSLEQWLRKYPYSSNDAFVITTTNPTLAIGVGFTPDEVPTPLDSPPPAAKEICVDILPNRMPIMPPRFGWPPQLAPIRPPCPLCHMPYHTEPQKFNLAPLALHEDPIDAWWGECLDPELDAPLLSAIFLGELA